jgi:cytochrome c oxidase subunit 2
VRRAFGAAILTLLAGCSGIQSMTDSAGHQTSLWNGLFGAFLWVTGIVYLLVIGFLLAAILRRGGTRQDGLPDAKPSAHEQGLRTVLVGWIALITIGLMALTLFSYFADRGLALAATRGDPLRIKVTAEQWWWRIEYQDPTSSNIFYTANELHLPVGTRASIELNSADVIHSFWVPNIAGKQDLIPGRTTDINLLPTRIGRYRGQCAEYCGVQHAHMALDVVVEPRARFAAWRAAQLRPAAPPATPLAKAGHDYFMSHQCSACHAITGTQAYGQVAPDLTHFASRASIAAGTLPNNRGNRYGWVADPQAVKPGTHMPTLGLEPRALDAVVAYLETLR